MNDLQCQQQQQQQLRRMSIGEIGKAFLNNIKPTSPTRKELQIWPHAHLKCLHGKTGPEKVQGQI